MEAKRAAAVLAQLTLWLCPVRVSLPPLLRPHEDDGCAANTGGVLSPDVVTLQAKGDRGVTAFGPISFFYLAADGSPIVLARQCITRQTWLIILPSRCGGIGNAGAIISKTLAYIAMRNTSSAVVGLALPQGAASPGRSCSSASATGNRGARRCRRQERFPLQRDGI